MAVFPILQVNPVWKWLIFTLRTNSFLSYSLLSEPTRVCVIIHTPCKYNSMIDMIYMQQISTKKREINCDKVCMYLKQTKHNVPSPSRILVSDLICSQLLLSLLWIHAQFMIDIVPTWLVQVIVAIDISSHVGMVAWSSISTKPLYACTRWPWHLPIVRRGKDSDSKLYYYSRWCSTTIITWFPYY